MTVIKTVKPSKISELLRSIKKALFDSYLEATVVFILVAMLCVFLSLHKCACKKSEDVMPKYGCDVAGPKYLSEHKGVCVTIQKT